MKTVLLLSACLFAANAWAIDPTYVFLRNSAVPAPLQEVILDAFAKRCPAAADHLASMQEVATTETGEAIDDIITDYYDSSFRVSYIFDRMHPAYTTVQISSKRMRYLDPSGYYEYSVQSISSPDPICE